MIFSIPINIKLSEQQFHEFFNFCSEYKHLIYDLYFTCRMPPFIQDAMGDIIVDDPYGPVENALHMQEMLGIKISATFNNIQVKPTQQNLDLFIENFTQLYESGVRIATIPHTHWMATGQIQKAFPELLVKNTILRNVTRPNEIAKLAEAGFHYINIDRDLMRDRDTLIRMKQAADKYDVVLSLLGNEGCLGNCPMMDEHYHFNNSRMDLSKVIVDDQEHNLARRTKGTFSSSPQYFNDPISRVSCPKWDYEDPSTPLKTADIPPWKEDWDELLNYVQVFKMHGRESTIRMQETMDIVRRYANNEEFLYDSFDWYGPEGRKKLSFVDDSKPIKIWREKIKNCKFDCWDCNYCDQVYEAKSNEQAHPLVLAVTKELVDSVHYHVNIPTEGLSSPKVQKLMFGLSTHCNRFLEIGSGFGTVTMAISDDLEEIHCVDNWSIDVQPESEDISLPNNSKDLFLKNIGNKKVIIHDSDIYSVDTSKINNIDLFFHDGPHDKENVKETIRYYKDCFADVCILVFDDANWEGVVSGASAGIHESGLITMYDKKMLNKVEDPSQWWNGLYIVVVKKEDV
jgi:predicted O-methyltransferase YrrM